MVSDIIDSYLNQLPHMDNSLCQIVDLPFHPCMKHARQRSELRHCLKANAKLYDGRGNQPVPPLKSEEVDDDEFDLSGRPWIVQESSRSV